MKPTPKHELFQALLDGSPKGDKTEAALDPLLKLATALKPSELPGPEPRFRARLRSELLAAATAAEEAEVDRFAAVVEGPARAPAELRPLVAVAAALESGTQAAPSPGFRYQLRNRLIAQAQSRAGLHRRAAVRIATINERMRRSLRAVVATATAAVMLAGGSVSFAASSRALPVDALYPLKQFKEGAELATRSGASKGFLYLDLARVRLSEVRGMTVRGVRDPAPYDETLETMDVQTKAGAEIIFSEFRDGAPREVVERVAGFARVQLQDLQTMLDSLPAGALPSARDSLIMAAQVAQRANGILKGCEVCPTNPLVAPPVAAPGQEPAACACRQPSGGDGSSGSTDGSGPTQAGSGDGTDTGDTDDPDDPEEPPPPPRENAIQIPDVPETDVDDTAEDLINELLEDVDPGVTEPAASPTPTLPVPTPSIPTAL